MDWNLDRPLRRIERELLPIEHRRIDNEEIELCIRDMFINERIGTIDFALSLMADRCDQQPECEMIPNPACPETLGEVDVA